MSELQQKVEQVIAVLTDAVQNYAPVVFANSFGAEDMVLTDLIYRNKLDIGMFSLDTGRLPPETYNLMQEVQIRYGVSMEIYFPDAAQIETYVAQNGINGFYDSVALRKRCCDIRKVEPLRRALQGKRAWITGIRHEQAATRSRLSSSAYDMTHQIQKFNPLLEWSNAQVWAYLKQNDVPYNKLHDQFFPSIGCAPCTRAVTPGEDIRAGRWWWEASESKECGLHVGKDARIKQV
jgi:phosphoadenosine phosphosulfate reductase